MPASARAALTAEACAGSFSHTDIVPPDWMLPPRRSRVEKSTMTPRAPTTGRAAGRWADVTVSGAPVMLTAVNAPAVPPGGTAPASSPGTWAGTSPDVSPTATPLERRSNAIVSLVGLARVRRSVLSREMGVKGFQLPGADTPMERPSTRARRTESK